MAEFPALPLWTDAYLGDTTHLTTIEHGAYLLLLMVAWRTADCALPDDDRLLARYARLEPRQWKRVKPILAEFFVIEDGKWTQGRLVDEREAVRTYRQKQSEKGVASGKARALKTKGRHKAAVKTGSDAVEPEANRERTPTPNKKEPKGSKKGGGKEEWNEPPVPVDAQVWQDFRTNRTRKRLPETATAYKRLVDDLARVAAATGMEQPEILTECTALGWGGIYNPKREERAGSYGDAAGPQRNFEDIVLEEAGRRKAAASPC